MARRILLVEDHLSTLDLLRSMLEYSSSDRQILGVPSAEEGLLAIRQASFDLVICDVRLPGMSGFDLVRKVRSKQPELPIIMITGYDSPESEQEARRLGVEHYFAKPMDMAALLAAIQALLDKPAPGKAATENALPVSPPVADKSTSELPPASPQRKPSQIERRLLTLQADTGARQVILANLDAEVVAAVGEPSGLNLLDLASQLAKSMSGSLGVAQELGGAEPFTVQYQAGQRHDVYSANIGSGFFVALLFADQTRRGRIGTVWVFTQRAVKDLKALLKVPTAREPKKPQQADRAVASGKPTQPAEGSTAAADVVQKAPSSQEGALQGKKVDLEAFWEAALAADQSEDSTFSGLTFEEAVRRGLIPPEFGEKEET